MEMSMKVKMMVGVVMMLMVASEASLTCGTVASKVSGCIPYLKGEAAISSGCCSGIRSLKALASTTADRRAACQCLKSAASSISGIDYKRAASLPSTCGASIPYKISPQTDCSSVN